MSKVRDTPITNNHDGTRPAVCGRNVAINIKVTIVRQTITLKKPQFLQCWFIGRTVEKNERSIRKLDKKNSIKS